LTSPTGGENAGDTDAEECETLGLRDIPDFHVLGYATRKTIVLR
jgi:hypothetical protein